MFRIAGALFILLHGTMSLAQIHCPEKNIAFREGEKLVYSVFYNLGMIWLEAGEGTFTAEKEIYKGRPVYHFKGEGHTYPNYDWIYRVRDLYEAWSDTMNLSPLRATRSVDEGGDFIYNDFYFDHKNQEVTSFVKYGKKPVTIDTSIIPKCMKDVLTMVYTARNFQYTNSKIYDTIPICIMLDHGIHNLYIRYLGKEILKTDFGNIKTLKFSPLLVEGTIFTGGEDMVVYVTDDDNKVPVYVETKILVGKIKVKLKSVYGLRNGGLPVVKG